MLPYLPGYRRVPDDLVIARNPEPGSTLPFLMRIPLGEHGIVVKARETWPRTSKIYCHRAEAWPAGRRGRGAVARPHRRPPGCGHRPGADPGSREPVAVRPDPSTGPGDDLLAVRQDGEAGATPGDPAHGPGPRPGARHRGRRARAVRVRVPHQQATTRKAPLRAGDYAITDGDEVIAAVERKSVEDLSSTLLSGRMSYLMADLASLPRAAVVVESGYSKIFKLTHAPGATVAGVAGRGPGQVPVGADRLLREPLARAGVGLPLVGCLPARARSPAGHRGGRGDLRTGPPAAGRRPPERARRPEG